MSAGRKVIIISACLAGLKTRYDGTDAFSAEACRIPGGAVLVPVCPEQLGGLPTPRPRSEIETSDGRAVLSGASRVVDESGADVTSAFARGAEETGRIARLTGATEARLKEKSPSCGVSAISRKGGTVQGMGVAAAVLVEAGVRVRGF